MALSSTTVEAGTAPSEASTQPGTSATRADEEDELSIFGGHQTCADVRPASVSGGSSSQGTGAASEPVAQPDPSAKVSDSEAAALEAKQAAKADALKVEGNALYAAGQYAEASVKYQEAIEAAPPTPGYAKQRAIYLANLAACDLQAKSYQEAVEACTGALEEDPTYAKALSRRFTAYEALEDVDHALKDAQQMLQLDPACAWAKSAVARLEPVVTEKNEKLKEEMMGQLKNLGNTILGKFGMSLDNFKAEKDPNTGGYSIKFG